MYFNTIYNFWHIKIALKGKVGLKKRKAIVRPFLYVQKFQVIYLTKIKIIYKISGNFRACLMANMNL